MFVTCYQHHTEEQPRSDAGNNWEPELPLFRAFMGEEKKGSQLLLTGNGLNRLKIMKQYSAHEHSVLPIKQSFTRWPQEASQSRYKEVNKSLWNPGRSLVRWLRSCCHSLMSLPEFWHFAGSTRLQILSFTASRPNDDSLSRACDCLQDFWLCRWISLNTKCLQSCKQKSGSTGFSSFRLKSLLETKENAQQTGVWCHRASFKGGGHLIPWPAHLAQAVDAEHLAHTPVQK